MNKIAAGLTAIVLGCGAASTQPGDASAPAGTQQAYSRSVDLLEFEDGTRVILNEQSDQYLLDISMAVTMLPKSLNVESKAIEVGWRRYQAADGSCAGEEVYIFDAIFSGAKGETRRYIDNDCNGSVDYGQIIRNVCEDYCANVPVSAGLDVLTGETAETRSYDNSRQEYTRPLRTWVEILIDELEDPSQHMRLTDDANEVFAEVKEGLDAENMMQAWRERGY
ncbi:MAG: hypothetical protein KJ955_05655 [Nanoarchaeota archaeon]|nr:hypothetical protein [Nanoarchaeota archaeon]